MTCAAPKPDECRNTRETRPTINPFGIETNFKGERPCLWTKDLLGGYLPAGREPFPRNQKRLTRTTAPRRPLATQNTWSQPTETSENEEHGGR